MTFPPLASLVPHRPPMLLLESVVGFEPGRVVCRARPRADCIFARNGSIPAVVSLEYMAQATAVLSALDANAQSSSWRPGFLASVRGLWLARATLRFEAELAVQALVQAHTDVAGCFECSIDLEGETIARARLTVVTAPEASGRA